MGQISWRAPLPGSIASIVSMEPRHDSVHDLSIHRSHVLLWEDPGSKSRRKGSFLRKPFVFKRLYIVSSVLNPKMYCSSSHFLTAQKVFGFKDMLSLLQRSCFTYAQLCIWTRSKYKGVKAYFEGKSKYFYVSVSIQSGVSCLFPGASLFSPIPITTVQRWKCLNAGIDELYAL